MPKMASHCLALLHLVLAVLHLPFCKAWSRNHTPNWPINDATSSRRAVLIQTAATISSIASLPSPSQAKCTDIDSCREIGERKDAENLAANPIVKLGGGLQYKVLRPGFGVESVTDKSKIKIIYSISQANGSYMYSRGFGYNKIDAGDGKQVSDAGFDSLAVDMADAATTIPVGIYKSLIGMKKGERRRIECPPKVGFETSDWNPQPTNYRGKQQIKDYKSTLAGRGSTQPAFPAPTIWDVEVLSIR